MYIRKNLDCRRTSASTWVWRAFVIALVLQIFLYLPEVKADTSRARAYPSAGGTDYFKFTISTQGSHRVELQYHSDVTMNLSAFNKYGGLLASNSSAVNIGSGCGMSVFSLSFTLVNILANDYWIKCEVLSGSMSAHTGCLYGVIVYGTVTYFEYVQSTQPWSGNPGGTDPDFWATYWWIFVVAGGVAVVIAIAVVRSRHSRGARTDSPQSLVGETQPKVETQIVNNEQISRTPPPSSAAVKGNTLPQASSPFRQLLRKITSTSTAPVDDIAAYLLEGLTLTPAKKEEEKND